MLHALHVCVNTNCAWVLFKYLLPIIFHLWSMTCWYLPCAHMPYLCRPRCAQSTCIHALYIFAGSVTAITYHVIPNEISITSFYSQLPVKYNHCCYWDYGKWSRYGINFRNLWDSILSLKHCYHICTLVLIYMEFSNRL